MPYIFNKKSKNNLNFGFTIVETIVSIFILSVAIVTMMAVFSRDIGSMDYLKDKMTALYLTQEGIEQFRNLRDDYVFFSEADIIGGGWNDFKTKLTDGGCFATGGCYFYQNNNFSFTGTSKEMIQNLELAACGSQCPEMYFDSSSGEYNYTVAGNSGFRRKINVTQINANLIKLTSTVYFTSGGMSGNLSFSENLYNLSM